LHMVSGLHLVLVVVVPSAIWKPLLKSHRECGEHSRLLVLVAGLLSNWPSTHVVSSLQARSEDAAAGILSNWASDEQEVNTAHWRLDR
jgi:hypothetical protein